MNFDVPSFLELLRKNSLAIATAESCTGGMISAALTNIAGSSDVVWGGFVSYANEAKTRLLAVPAELIAEKGAVSREVAEAMAAGALDRSDANLAVAVSGIAGPGGGTADKPVGTVWIAAALDKRIESRLFHFKGDRAAVRTQTADEALRLCEKIILERSSLDSDQR